VSVEAVLALLTFLDNLFGLAGKLVEAATQKHPELNTKPLPDLSAMDKAREDAVKRGQLLLFPDDSKPGE
jgi:hypothetical protein